MHGSVPCMFAFFEPTWLTADRERLNVRDKHLDRDNIALAGGCVLSWQQSERSGAEARGSSSRAGLLLAYVHLCLGMHLLWTSRGFVCIFRQVCVRQGHMACRMSWQMTAAVDVRTCKVVFLCNRKRQMNMEKQNKHRQLSLHVCYLSCWSRPDRIAPHSHSHTHTHTHTHTYTTHAPLQISMLFLQARLWKMFCIEIKNSTHHFTIKTHKY